MKNKSWIIKSFIITFFITILISGLSNFIANKTNIIIWSLIALIILIIGIIFDAIGTSVLTAEEASFHAKASNKIKGSKEAVKLIKNASTIASFCNDVIGDICGIISGMMVAMIAIDLANKLSLNSVLTALLLSSLLSSLTVGGKAIGKSIALKKSDDIVFLVAKIINKLKK